MTRGKCKDEVEKAFKGRMKDINRLCEAIETSDKFLKEKIEEDLGTLWDYGLSIDFVEAGTFADQRADYMRYQLSYGGPSEEFRIYKNGEVEFWYLDWYDGACVQVEGEDADTIKNIIELSGVEEK